MSCRVQRTGSLRRGQQQSGGQRAASLTRSPELTGSCEPQLQRSPLRSSLRSNSIAAVSSSRLAPATPASARSHSISVVPGSASMTSSMLDLASRTASLTRSTAASLVSM